MAQDTTPTPRLADEAPAEPVPTASASAALTLFVEAVQQAGLLGDLDDAWLEAHQPRPDEPREAARRLDLLEAYYGDVESAEARRVADRFVLHRSGDRHVDAGVLVARLAEVTPELPRIRLERLGSAEGPLVLRSAEAVAPVLDDEASAQDTNEIDLSEVMDAPETVAVRSLVAALNQLLDRAGVAARLVALRADATREGYVGVDPEGARTLFGAGALEDADLADVDELASWSSLGSSLVNDPR